MSEQEKMDRLLREAMGATPTPGLSDGFEERLTRKLRQHRLDATGRLTMIVYTLLALAASIGVMRAQAIAWSTIANAIVVPLLLVLALQTHPHILRRWVLHVNRRLNSQHPQRPL